MKFSIFYFLLFGLCSASLTTDYYNQLIGENWAQYAAFVPPQTSEEFRNGANSSTILDFGEYDFVIVGAGSAGSVLATRLSEIDDFSILILEAGGEEDDFNVIPDAMVVIQNSKRNWAYYGQPNNYTCLVYPNQMCQISKGKGIGGTSSINGMIYTRGGPENYNEWIKKGIFGWSYNDVLPYFLKSENSQVDGDKPYHNKGGLLNVQYALPHSPLLKSFLDGCAELNVPRVDYNARKSTGAGPLVYTIKHGKRQSTGAAFLDMARQRKNLKVVTKALATKILFNGKKATGIEFVTYDKKYKVKAKKEVILSAGAINSPQLLMLSGIGPKEHLQSFGIPVVANLPVGKTLKDHVTFYLFLTTNYTETISSMETQVQEYLNGYGPFTKSVNLESVVFIKTKKSSDAPSVEIMFGAPSISRVLNFAGTFTNTTQFVFTLLDSKSSGWIKLKSTDPLDYPLINENLLSVPEDLETLKKGVKFARQLLQTNAFKQVNVQELPFSACTNFDIQSENYLNCVISAIGGPTHHTSVTTPMGINPQTSVVDNKLKVHGIKNLRVVDAGVFPTLLAAHTNAPTIMLAEKISDAIKLEHAFWG